MKDSHMIWKKVYQMQDRLLTFDIKKSLCSWFPAFSQDGPYQYTRQVSLFIYQYFQTSAAQYKYCSSTSIFKHPQPNTILFQILLYDWTREYCDWLTYGPLPHPPCYVNKSNFSLINWSLQGVVACSHKCHSKKFIDIFRLKNGKCVQ